MDEYKHVAAMAHAQGLEFALLTPAEAKAKYPFLETHDLVGASGIRSTAISIRAS